MSPDPSGVAEAGGSTDAPLEASGEPTFTGEVEKVDETTTTQRPGPRPKRAQGGRFLDDPDPDAPRKPARRAKVRARKVRRIVRHVEPWSVLKISLLFFLSLFVIICVASALLWNVGRDRGAIDDVESFVTSLGFGNCEDIEGAPAADAEAPPVTVDGTADQLAAGEEPPVTEPVAPANEDISNLPGEDGDCREGQVLVGAFKFDDGRIFQAFALGGVVLVLAGSAAAVVMALLFNLISDLTGGIRVTVLEEDDAVPLAQKPPKAKRARQPRPKRSRPPARHAPKSKSAEPPPIPDQSSAPPVVPDPVAEPYSPPPTPDPQPVVAQEDVTNQSPVS